MNLHEFLEREASEEGRLLAEFESGLEKVASELDLLTDEELFSLEAGLDGVLQKQAAEVTPPPVKLGKPKPPELSPLPSPVKGDVALSPLPSPKVVLSSVLGFTDREGRYLARHDFRKEASVQGMTPDAILGEAIDLITSGKINSFADTQVGIQKLAELEKAAKRGKGAAAAAGAAAGAPAAAAGVSHGAGPLSRFGSGVESALGHGETWSRPIRSAGKSVELGRGVLSGTAGKNVAGALGKAVGHAGPLALMGVGGYLAGKALRNRRQDDD